MVRVPTHHHHDLPLATCLTSCFPLLLLPSAPYRSVQTITLVFLCEDLFGSQILDEYQCVLVDRLSSLAFFVVWVLAHLLMLRKVNSGQMHQPWDKVLEDQATGQNRGELLVVGRLNLLKKLVGAKTRKQQEAKDV